LSDDVINLTTDKEHRIFGDGQRIIHSCSINRLFTVHVWLFGAESQAFVSLQTMMGVQLVTSARSIEM
jgi:hypothetical protein